MTRRTLVSALPIATLLLATLLLANTSSTPAYAQQHESALSEGEIEKLRDTAYDPPERVAIFIAFLNQRADAIGKQIVGKRRPGREEDIHDQMEQFTSIADDLDDNLGDYAARHRDLRKVLPKLVAATERWATTLKSPPDHDAYNVSRKLALEANSDIREAASKLVEEQRAYFLQHPPSKESDKYSPSEKRPRPF